jgi:hypothetical protein
VNVDTGEFRAIEARPAEVLAEVGDWAAHPAMRSPGRKPPRVIELLIEHAREAGAEVWAYELGYALLELRDDGASDAVVIEAALEMIAARMSVGLPHETWFDPDEGP